HTNALFLQLHEEITGTDGYCANNLQEIKAQIEDYIRRMGELRDSFGNKFTTEADGMVYFGSSSQSVVTKLMSHAETADEHLNILAKALNIGWKELISNSSAIVLEETWKSIEEWFSRGAANLTDDQFNVLARIFTDMDYLGDIERFLNTLARPIELNVNLVTNFNQSELQSLGLGFHSVCTTMVDKLKQHLGLALTAGLEVQIGLGIDDPLNSDIDALREAMIKRIALLSVIYAAAAEQPNDFRHTVHPMFVSVGENGPFSLTEGVLTYGNNNERAVTTLSFNFGNINIFPENITIEPIIPREINLFPVLNGAGAGSLILALALEQLLNQHEFNASSFAMSQLTSSALDGIKSLINTTAPVIGTMFEAALTMYKLSSELNKSESIQNDFRGQNEVAMFAKFVRDFSMQTIVIHEEGRDWHSMTWPTRDSELGLRGLNGLNIPDNDPSLPWINEVIEQMRVAEASNPIGSVTTTAPGAIEISFNLDFPPGVPVRDPLNPQYLHFTWEDFLNRPDLIFEFYKTRGSRLDEIYDFINEMRDIRSREAAIEEFLAQQAGANAGASNVDNDRVVTEHDIVLPGQESTLPGHDTPHYQ
ncbi:MAG: hypothetical protein FWC71_09220, partial [Defluviitaleaceae bacterium]|nr:hypothetical protein [Defluviitaleaceae bacterium]